MEPARVDEGQFSFGGRLVLPSLIAFALTGCFATKPHDNLGFVTAQALQALAGTYQNLGESRDGAHFLSLSIWPDDKALRHAAITAVSVRALGDTALTVRALQGDSIVKEGTYREGESFTFARGRLRLRTRLANSLKEPEAGGLFVARITQELGVDQKGQGKLKKREIVVGAAYLVVPIAVSLSTEVRFVRLGGP